MAEGRLGASDATLFRLFPTFIHPTRIIYICLILNKGLYCNFSFKFCQSKYVKNLTKNLNLYFYKNLLSSIKRTPEQIDLGTPFNII